MHVYETSDLGLASSLCCLGYPILGLDRHDPRRVVFCFDVRQEGVEEAVKAYWDGSLRLSPAALFVHQKTLKQRLYGEQP